MKSLSRWVVIGIASTSIIPSWAATVIERSDMSGEKQKLSMEEKQARLDNSAGETYTLIDLEKEKAYLIHVKEKQIVTMNIVGTPPKIPTNMRLPDNLPQPPWANKPLNPELVNAGEGPKIAGYATVKYVIKAMNRECSETYFSAEVAKIPYVKNFLDAMLKMANSRKPTPPKGVPVHPCQQAHEQFEAESSKLGVPMKSVIKRGEQEDKVRYEIVSVKTDVALSKDSLVLPSNYQQLTEEEFIAQQQAKMNKWMEEESQQPRSQRRWQENQE
jgi:hypothetical protein